MKYLIYISLFLIIISESISQSVSVFNVDYSKFPTVKAKLFALDKYGFCIKNLDQSNFVLKEDDIVRTITNLSCPEIKPPEAISSVLTIDISGSMSGAGIEKAKLAANTWVNSIPLGKSECAITTFDQDNYLNCDFTTDKNKLQKAIDSLKAQGGTDFNSALINPMSGSLLIAESGKHQKVIVLLTDGFSTGDQQRIIEKAKSMNAVIYCVILGNPAPDVLKNIALATGGTYFENINTAEEAAIAYVNILQMAQGGSPCEMEWLSSGCPINRKIEISLPAYSISNTAVYSIPTDSLPNISLLPGLSLKYGPVLPGYFGKKSLKIICGKSDVFISEIISDNALFKVKNFPQAGLNMRYGDQFDLNVEFNPIDSSYQFARFEIVSNACKGTFFYASGGFSGTGSTVNTLKILEPNGGEIYAANADTVIRWDGVAPDDTMKIELSVDGGIQWQTLTNKAQNLQFNYKMPNLSTDKCLIRMKQLEGSGSKLTSYTGHSFFVDNISISPDNRYIASTGNDRVFKAVDLKTGQQAFKNTGVYIYQCSSFSPDGKLLAVGLSDFSVQLLSTTDWSLVNTLQVSGGWINALAFSPDSKLLSVADNTNYIKIVKLEDNTIVSTLTGHSAKINQLKYTITNSDTTLISTSTDGMIKLWNTNGENTKTINTGLNLISFALSPDNYRAAIVAGTGKQVRIIDLKTGLEIKSFIPDNTASSIDWSPDGALITVGDNMGNANFYSGEDYQFIKTIKMHSMTINQLAWSKTGKFLASCSNDNYIKTIEFELSIQEAVSDNYWEITAPNFSTKDINFGTVTVGSVSDSIVKSFIVNNSKIPIRVDSIKFSSTESSDFSLLSGIPPFEIPANTVKDLEFRFNPSLEGLRAADINVYTNSEIIKSKISGTAYQTKIEYVSKYVNFGKREIDFEYDTTLNVIQNKSNSDITFSNIRIIGPEMEQYSLLSPDLSIVKPGEYLSLHLKYSPSEKGRSNTAIAMDYSGCNCRAQVQVFGEGYSVCGESSFNYSDFKDISNINFLGTARKFNDSILILTTSSKNIVGALWNKTLIPIDSGFTTEFSFRIADAHQYNTYEKSEPGADGLAFVIQNQSPTAIGTYGGGLGYEGIRNAIAVEIDLFSNDQMQIEDKKDPNGNHVALKIISDSILRGEHLVNNTPVINTNPIIVKSDETVYYCKFVYNSNEKYLEFYLDSTAQHISPAIRYDNFDISQYINLTNGRGAYIGLTGACGSSYQSHEILNFKACTALNSAPVVSVEEEINISDTPRIYPNPAENSCTLSFNSQIGDNIEITSYDVLGRNTDRKIQYKSFCKDNLINILQNNGLSIEFVNICINNIKTFIVPIHWK